MKTRFPTTGFVALLGSLTIGAAVAAPVTYKIDPRHTFPTFHVNRSGFRCQIDSQSAAGLVKATKLQRKPHVTDLKRRESVARIDLVGHRRRHCCANCQ